MNTTDILQNYIYPNLDILSLLSELEPKEKTTYYTLICPQCGKKEAYIPKKLTLTPVIICNRKNKCAYTSSIWDYIKSRSNLTNKEILHLLAHHSNTNLDQFSIKNTYPKKSFKKHVTIKYKKTFTKLPINYKTFDLNSLILKYTSLSNYEKFKTILTFIYNFSLQTNHDKKIGYYNSRYIKSIPNDIGFLSKKDLSTLTDMLLANFPLNDLKEFEIFKDNHFKFNFSDFCIIPSFDLSSNLITALRFRNIYKSKIKELELSNKRMLNPLPYPITYQKIKKYNSFVFTEGHIDALSLSIKNFVAIEGVSSFNFYHLGLFFDKKIYLAFDLDEAGIKATKKFEKVFKKLNISYEILTWDKKYGKDINEILSNGYNPQKILNLSL